MPAGLTSPGWALRVALFAALPVLLTDCGPTRNQFAPPCPGQAILGDVADLTLYRAGSTGHDLTDLVLHARIVGLQGSCQEGDKKNQLAVTANIGVELTRGPAMAGREIDVPVFIAVVDGSTVVDKRTYLMRAAFPPNIDRVTLSPANIGMVLPVTADKSGAAYTIVTGFQRAP